MAKIIQSKVKSKTTESTALPSRLSQIYEANAEYLTEKKIKLEHLAVSPVNTYGFREEEILELAASISSVGLMDSLIVEKRSETCYEILSGQKRFLAISRIRKENPDIFRMQFPGGEIKCRVFDIEHAIFPGETKENRYSIEAKRHYIISSGNIQHVKTASDYMIGFRSEKAFYEEQKKLGIITAGVKKRDYIGQYMNLSGVSVQTLIKAEQELTKEQWAKLETSNVESLKQLSRIVSLEPEKRDILIARIGEEGFDIEGFISGDSAKPAVTDDNEEKKTEAGEKSSHDTPSRSMRSKDIEKLVGADRLRKAIAGIDTAKEIKGRDIEKLEALNKTLIRKAEIIEQILKKYKKQ